MKSPPAEDEFKAESSSSEDRRKRQKIARGGVPIVHVVPAAGLRLEDVYKM
jgi:hypothetical protein